jgi:hypothetical protein
MKMKKQGESTTVWQQKLYTQHEVDNLLEEKEEKDSTTERNVSTEKPVAEKQENIDKRKVANLIKKSNRILVSITSHAFPFDFFPDIINVEEGRITVINRHLLSSEVHSIDIKDISNIFINTTAFRSQLVIISKTFESNEISIKNLITKDAVYIRRIIEGLRVFINKQIETSSYSAEELVSKLEELSTTEIVM